MLWLGEKYLSNDTRAKEGKHSRDTRSKVRLPSTSEPYHAGIAGRAATPHHPQMHPVGEVYRAARKRNKDKKMEIRSVRTNYIRYLIP